LIALAASGSIAIASVPAIIAFPGSAWLAALFCTLAGGLVPLVILRGRSAFRILIGLFLALGFWAKFVAHFAIGTALIEPIGQFSGTPDAWNAALGTASAGLAGVGTALLATAPLKPTASTPTLVDPSGILKRFGIAVLVASLVAAFVIFAFNFRFAILKIGFVPTLALHPYLYVLVAFAVSWGIALWLLVLTWWLIETGRLPPSSLIYLGAAEGAVAALSMGSRVQMILHVLAATLAFWQGTRYRGWRISRSSCAKLVLAVGLLFGAALLAVSLDRAYSFTGAVPDVTPAAAPASSTSQPPAAPNAGTPAAPATAAAAATRDDDVQREQRIREKIRSIPNEISRLFVMRWVGLEGVLTTVGADDRLGPDLLHRGLLEQPSAGVDALYQRMSEATYQRFSNFVFMTIPGPLAVAHYGGSLILCFLLLATLVLLGTFIEYATDRLTGNPAAASLTGVALSYLIVQMNFPRTLFFFVLELVGAVLILACIRLLLNNDWRFSGFR